MTKSRSFYFALSWLIFISILFFLPGSAIPKNDWLGDIHFDKWVHVGFFAVLTWLWSMALQIRKSLHIVWMIVIAALYGLMVEIIQDQFVLNRSFDSGDLGADAVGACFGSLYWYRTYIKR